jgi:hypothetical protein
MAHIKKHLGFAGLLKTMANTIKQIDDNRQQAKVNYCMHDCVMSAFAMMYLQDPSLLAFQRRIQDRIQRNNLIIDELKRADMSFILVAKPSDHKILMEDRKRDLQHVEKPRLPP